MLYQLNTVMRLFGFLSRGIVFLAVGFILGVLYNEGKVHFPSLSLIPIAKAATVEPYTRTPSGTPITEGIVHFEYSATDLNDGTNYIQFSVNVNHAPYEYTSSCLDASLGIVNGTLNIPAAPGEYYDVAVNEYIDSDCSFTNGNTAMDDNFTVLSAGSSTATTTATTTENLSRGDSLFLWGVAIFLLSYPVWTRIFKA